MTMMTNNAVVPDRRKNINNDHGLSLTTLPLPLLILIVNTLGTQEDLTNISVLSKQFHIIVHLPAIDTKIIRIYELSPSKNSRGSCNKLLQRLVHNQLNNNEKFSHYHHFKVNRINEFDVRNKDSKIITEIDIAPIDSITSLDISLLHNSSSLSQVKVQVLDDMKNLLSNSVQEINLSYVRFKNSLQQRKLLRRFFSSLSSLEKVTWHHCDRDIIFNGSPFHPTNTKEIYSDNSLFTLSETTIDLMSSSNFGQRQQHDDNFYMFYCYKSLECLSIRNAKYTDHIFGYLDDNNIDDCTVRIDIPQNALIKFVRKSPTSMRWFRSDLTKENMDMLRKERPEIQLLN